MSAGVKVGPHAPPSRLGEVQLRSVSSQCSLSRLQRYKVVGGTSPAFVIHPLETPELLSGT